jgi:glycosyltransferase involved in cell wall biosynthesis
MADSTAQLKSVSVVIPLYNERNTIDRVFEAVLNQPSVLEIVVVDDCSRDGSAERVQEIAACDSRVRVFRHEFNQGKGAALRTGIRECRGDYVLIQDADLEYDPAEYSALLRPLWSGKADAVFESRFIGSHEHRVLYFWHSVSTRSRSPTTAEPTRRAKKSVGATA